MKTSNCILAWLTSGLLVFAVTASSQTHSARSEFFSLDLRPTSGDEDVASAPSGLHSVSVRLTTTDATDPEDVGVRDVSLSEGDFASGTVIYERLSPTEGRIDYFDSSGYSGTYRLVFDSPSTGVFRDDYTDPLPGFETGTFEILEIDEAEVDFFGLLPGTHDRRSVWFGRFDDRHFDHEARHGWIWHQEHGWLYAAGRGASESLWLWDHIQQDWFWTRGDLYPFLFSDEKQSWFYYLEGGTPNLRDFYDYSPEVDGWTEVR